jgi:hypothetical protein
MAERPLPDDNSAPELDNSEQEDEREQTHTIAEEALRGEARVPSPLDSTKRHGGINDEDAPQDLIDRMRDMEQSGRIDMGAFEGEPNFDDDEDKYGDGSKEDDLPGDGAE